MNASYPDESDGTLESDGAIHDPIDERLSAQLREYAEKSARRARAERYGMLSDDRIVAYVAHAASELGCAMPSRATIVALWSRFFGAAYMTGGRR